MRHTRRAALPIGLCLVLLLGACRSIPGAGFLTGLVPSGSGSDMTQEELRDALLQYASNFEATVIAAADTISAGAADPLIQRATLRWKLGITPIVNHAAFLSEPEDSYVAMLTIATSMHEFLTTGAGNRLFGEQQAIATDAASSLLAAAVTLGDRFLDQKELAKVTTDVEKLVREQPIRGEFATEQIQTLVTKAEASPIFDWITAIPMSPFRALQGVDEGAQAIRDFNVTAMEMARIADAMPRLVRWNLELLSLNLTQQAGIGTTLESFASFSRSAESLSQTAGALPGDLRALLEEAERTGQSLSPLSESLERSATAVAQAGEAWGQLVAELGKPPADPTKPSRPFDIREWEQTAAQISSAASELRALLDSAGTLAGSDTLAGALDDLTLRVERVEVSSRALVDLAAWRGLQLIVAFFVLLFLARRIESWLGRRAAARAAR